MRYADLSTRPYDAEQLSKYDALYRGGDCFKKSLPRLLPRNPLESPQVYRLRIAEAYYRSYVGPIVDFFAAQLFSAPLAVRSLGPDGTSLADDYYGILKEDVDGCGTDLIAFMKGRFTEALVKGCSWWVAEFADDGGDAPQDRLEYTSRGLDVVRLCPIPTENVIDWECDDLGQLLWAITYSCSFKRPDPRIGRNLKTETWKIYDRENVETFSITYDPKEKRLQPDDQIPSIGITAHRFPRVPLIQMRLPEGLWILNRTADGQIEHFRMSNALAWAMRRTCYPMAVFKSANPDKPPVTGAGYITTIGLEEDFEWAAPDAAPFEVLRDEIDSQKNEIFRISQQMAHSVDNSAVTAGRSGESKLQDNAATEICLLAYSIPVREAIENTFELVSDARGDVEVHFSIEGMDRFNLDAVTVTLDNIAKAKALGIESPTLNKELSIKASDLLLPDAQQQVKDAIREEINAGPKEPVQGQAAPPMPPQPQQSNTVN